MRKKINHNDRPVGRLQRIPDFLPSPDELVVPEDIVKITIFLNKGSVDFFRKQAKKNHTKYQRMIRALLDSYVRQYSA